VRIWPPWGANPVDAHDRADYYDSMFHSAVVVGINTSAMLECAIVRKPVFTIRDPVFTDTQDGTVHFRYLLRENGGPVQTAVGIGQHLEQLSATLADLESTRAETQAFVERFLRPGDLERPRTPVVADVIERVAASQPAPAPSGLAVGALRLALRPLAALTWLGSPPAPVTGRILAPLPKRWRKRIIRWRASRLERRRLAVAPPARAPARAQEPRSEPERVRG
jgi:hypothetical protein